MKFEHKVEITEETKKFLLELVNLIKKIEIKVNISLNKEDINDGN